MSFFSTIQRQKLKKGILFLWTIFLFSSALSQNIWFHDEFTQNRAKWQIKSERSSLGDGILNMESEVGSRENYVMEQYLDWGKKFQLETTVRHINSTGNTSYGLLWGGDEELENYFAFEINPAGFARVIKVEGENTTVLVPWKKSGKIKKKEADNQLAVRKEGRGAYFSVNGKDLFRIDFPVFFGFFQGLTLSGNALIEVESFTVLHPKIEWMDMAGTWPDARKITIGDHVNLPLNVQDRPFHHPRENRLYFLRQNTLMETHPSDTGWVDALALEGEGAFEQRDVIWMNVRGDAILGDDHRLFEAVVKGNQISELKEMPIVGMPKEASITDAYVTKDKQTLIFASNLPGGYGGMDLYVSEWKGDTWSKPENLGPSINTFATEYSPFLEENKKMLYFGSNGRAGYGRGDMYRIQRISKSWSLWSPVLNLGPGINTARWDKDFIAHPFENKTYFIATQDSALAFYEIFRVKIPRDLEEEGFFKVYGNIYLEGTDRPVQAKVYGLEISGGRAFPVAETKENKIAYGMTLPMGERYQIYALAPGFYPLPDTLNARPFKVYREIKKDLYVRRMEKGVAIELETVFFERGKANLLPESFVELNRLAFLMQSTPGLRIEIRGHTDNVGNPPFLQRLSEARAETVKEYLSRRGVSDNRMETKGFGATLPIAPNDNPVSRAKNRRVEFVIQ
ncbi:MAG: OmpA family protein [Bacteroidota bacterium]